MLKYRLEIKKLVQQLVNFKFMTFMVKKLLKVNLYLFNLLILIVNLNMELMVILCKNHIHYQNILAVYLNQLRKVAQTQNNFSKLTQDNKPTFPKQFIPIEMKVNTKVELLELIFNYQMKKNKSLINNYLKKNQI